MSEAKQNETFKVVDRRLFTAEGELRKDVAEQQDREHDAATLVNASAAASKAPVAPAAPPPAGSPAKPDSRNAAAATQPAPDAPKRLPAMETLIRSLGQNAAMLLGGYTDPRTGQPMIDMEGAHEIIDILDALREKTRGNLAPEEETLMIDLLGNLKLAFVEVTKATAEAATQDKTKSH